MSKTAEYDTYKPPEASLFSPQVTLLMANQTTIPTSQLTQQQLETINSIRTVSAAAAQTCYSQEAHTPLGHTLETDPKNTKKSNIIARSVFEAGHHSTIEHSIYTFLLEGVSRLSVWQWLHSHQHYVSDQQSQRYVKMTPSSLIPIDYRHPKLNQLASQTSQKLFKVYANLNQVLKPTIETAYQDRYGRTNDPAIDKLTQEIGRYLLPQSTATNLLHTIDALTLIRYHRLQNTFGPEEQAVVQAMTQVVCHQDPTFAEYIKNTPIETDTTPEYIARQSLGIADTPVFSQGNPDWYQDSPVHLDIFTPPSLAIAQAIRIRLGCNKDQLTDQQAISLVLDPQNNRYLTSVFGESIVDQFSQTLRQAGIVAQIRLSLSADAQLQRHRSIAQTAPGIIPIPISETDFYLPPILNQNQQALDLYLQTCFDTTKIMRQLIESGAPPDMVQYLAPNAVLINKQISAPLDGLYHFAQKRTCFRAQPEIWQIAIDLLKQLQHLDPVIAPHLDHITPCAIRHMANVTPPCPEGIQWCGKKNWDKKIDKLGPRSI